MPLLRQAVYSRLAGYEDTNGAKRLAQDPAMRVILGWRGLEKPSGQQVTCEYTGPDISPGGFLPTLIITVTIAPIEQFPWGSDAVDNCAQVRHPDDVNPENDHPWLAWFETIEVQFLSWARDHVAVSDE